ncbi:MAG TPA: hypothetical protein VGK88_06660 [bacterium]|jgi:hypothetical protein
MRRDRLVWILVWLAMFVAAWVYAGTFRAASSAQITLLPTDITVRASPLSPLHPLLGLGAPADPFTPQVGGSPQPSLSPPPPAVPLPPPPLPEPPGAPPLAPPAPAVEAPPFKLTGVVFGAVKRAVLESKETAYIVKEGDVVEGWTVVRIEPRRVVLRGQLGEVILELESTTP